MRTRNCTSSLSRRTGILSALSLILVSATGDAQSLLDRSPNLSGDWIGNSGTLYFNFVHRFSVSDAPERKVSNVPTFLVAAGLPKRFLAGFNYSTNSTLAPRFPNEWELFVRWQPLSQDLGAPLDLSAQVGYNNAADGGDAEVSVARRSGMVRAIVAGRALSDPFEEGNVRFAVAGGATIRLNQYFALAGDIASLMNRDSAERIAWSAGIHLAIPLTPHTFSLHATNALLTTLQGASRGSGDIRYGFEFTIPLTLRRYFGRRAEQPVDSAAASEVAATVPDSTVATVQAIAPPPAEVPAAQPAITPPAPTPASAPPAAPPPVSAPPAAPGPARTEAPSRTAAPKPAASRPAAPRPAAHTVRTTIRNVSYMQPRLQITVGTTVEWTNSDPMPHSVTAVDKSFDSGLINPGRTYRRTFTKAGTYNFFCVPHPFIKVRIVEGAQGDTGDGLLV